LKDPNNSPGKKLLKNWQKSMNKLAESKHIPLNILISAYACKPNMGSEPGVGWNTACSLNQHHQVWVLTRSSNRSEIETISENYPDLHFIYCDPPWWGKLWKSTQLPHYYFWQLGAYRVAKQLHQIHQFDVVHHVTYVRYSTPSFLSLLPIPFIWGPVGGGEMAPYAFWNDFSVRGKTYEILRRLAHWLGEKDPFTRLTARRSALIRATTKETAQKLQNMASKPIEIISESGLTCAEINQLGQFSQPSESPFRLISMARLLHWKGLHLGIKAFAQADLPKDSEYWILGTGPELNRLKTLTLRHKVAHRVRFLGQLTRSETLTKLSQCHVLVHPSLHDSGGWVCLESMAACRPVICLNTGGPGIQVTNDTGIKIDPQSPEQAIRDMAVAMKRLAENPDLCRKLGQAGQKRVKTDFSWEMKERQLTKLYRKLINEHRDRQSKETK
jgi:glycosyltransferase involved in cell wall biosynthesis